MKSAFFIRMFPKETPIKLLIEHAAILEEISRLIKPLIESWFQNEDIYEQMKFISKRESDADEIKFQIRKMLSQSVRTPFAVKDILKRHGIGVIFLHYFCKLLINLFQACR